MDRFVDGSCRYAMEWEDFLVLLQSNPQIETARYALVKLESMRFFATKQRMQDHRRRVVDERNRLAELSGLPLRDYPPS